MSSLAAPTFRDGGASFDRDGRDGADALEALVGEPGPCGPPNPGGAEA